MASEFLKKKARERREALAKGYTVNVYDGSTGNKTGSYRVDGSNAATREDEEEERKKSSSTASNSTARDTTKKSSSFLQNKAAERRAVVDKTYGPDAYGGSQHSTKKEPAGNKTSYLDTARNATKATITTGASKISAQDKDRRRKELETELDDLNDRLRLNKQKQVGAMRGHASNLAKEAAVEYEEITSRISEINKELEMLDQPDTISSYDQLTGNLEDAKERQAKAQRAVSQYSGNAGGRALAALPAEEREALYKELNEANAAVAALSRQQEQIDYLNDWQDVTLEKDNFWNQTKANYRVGRITQDTNEAFNTYIMNPTEENKDYAYALEELLAQYQQNNAKILDDEGAKATWISKSAAGYLPQFWDQTKAQVAGGAVGGLIGASVGNPVTGIKVGASAASGLESYGQMRGAAYRSLIAAGVDDETALAAANDEAFISALIESVGTYASFMTLGGSKALGAIGNAALKSGSKNAAVKAVASLFGKSATDKLAKQAAKEAGKSTLRKGIELLGGLGLEAVSEYAEEASQEGVSIANQNRENTGKWDLAKEAAGVIKDAVTGENEEARSQIHEAGKEGAKISLMFGSVQTTTNTIVSKMANAKTKAERDTVVNEVLNDKESLSALIEEGKASGENSVSAKIAQEIESKVSSGKEVTKDDVRRLIVSNAEYIKAENAEQATEAPQSASERTLTEEVKVPSKARSVTQAQASEAAAGKQSVPYNVMSRSDTTRKGATAPGYGEVGTRTFAEIVEESGRSADEVRAQFQTSYELGKLEMPREKVRFESTIQESAYNAGRQDAILSMKKAESKGATVWGKDGGLIQNEYSAKLSKQTADTLQKIGKATGTKIVFDAQVGGGDANGAYVDSQGTIHIAADAKNPVMVVVKHELTHRLQSLAPKEYTQFRNYAVQVMSEGRWGMYNSNTAVEAQQEKYYQLSKGRVNLTTEQAMDEIAADFTERILTDEKALNDFVSHVTKSEEHRTMGQKFFQAVREFIDKVKRIFKGDEAKMDEAAKEEYGVTIEQLEKAEQLWKQAYKAATERAQSATKNTAQVDGDGVMFSFKGVNQNGIEVYETSTEVKAMTWADRRKLFLDLMENEYRGRTAKFIRNGHAYYATFTEDDVRKNIYGDKRSDKKGRDAKINAGASGDIFTLVENATYKGSKPEEGKSTRAHDGVGYWDYFVKKVQIDNKVFDLLANVRKKKEGEYVYSLQLREDKKTKATPPNIPQKTEGFNRAQAASTGSVARQEDNVKSEEQYSLKDSTGKELTKAQAEYFKDSVIRDKNGNLMPMYHGTKRGGFTVFDGGKDYWYFTNDEKYAYTFEGRKDTGEFYPVVKEGIESGIYTPQRYTVYLNVKNPFVTDDADIIEDALYWDKTLAGELRKKGYDALMFEDMSQVIVLNANQIKDTTNKNPTDDPDIRYSLKKSVEDYRADLEAAKRELADHGERYFDLPNWQEIDHFEWMKKRDSLRNKVKRIEGKIAELSIPSGDGANIEEMKARLEGLELKISGMKNYNRLNFPNAQARQEFDERYANYQAEARGLRKAIKALSYPRVESSDPVDSKAFASWFGDWKSGKGSKVVDADGKPLIVYHGTGTVIEEFLPEFTGQGVDQYGSGFYFTTSRSTAENYTTRTLNGQDKPDGMDNPNVIPVYLNIRKPIVVDAAETPNLYNFDVTPTMAARIIAKAPDIMDSEESVLGDYFDEYWERGPQRYMISRLANEYDWTLGTLETDIFRDHPTEFRQAVKDVLGYDGVQVNFTSGEKHFVAWFPNQIKHATENSGAYSKSDNRIKFSLKENTDLQRENAKLKEVNAALREQFKTTNFAKVDPKELGKFARKLLKDYTSETDLDEVQNDLDKLYTYLANGEDGNTPAWDTAYRMAYKIAENVIRDASVLNDDMYTEYADLRHRLRTRGISLSKEYEHDIPGYEDLNDFRKRNFGRIKITKDGLDVNTAYQELASTYPGLFDEYTYSHPADQLAHIVEVLESMEPIEENPFSYNMREATTWLANDIMERFFELPQAKPTFADKAQRKVTEQVIKDSKKLERVREQNRERVSKIIAEYREKVKETRQKEKSAKWEAVGKVKEHYKAKEAKMSESRKAAVLRERISRHVADLKQKLLRPTDKKHIPQDLQGAVAKLLESINQESKYEYVVGEDGRTHRVERGTVPNAEPAKRTKAFAELQAVYAQLANELTVDPDLLGDDGLLNDVIKLADKPLADMTSDELRIVWDTLRAIEASVRTANKIHNAARWHTVEEAANALLEDNGEKKEKTELRGILGKGQKLTGLDMETPETFFHMLGNAGGNLFRMMRNAQDQHIRLMKEVSDFTHETLGNVNVRKLESEMHDVTLGGDKVKLSTAQIMELYVLSKRQQAIEHIFVGGILPDVVSAKGIKKITRSKPSRGITLGDVSDAVRNLTDEQRELADKLQAYASTTLGKWGNQTSMKVYGYEKFGEKNYWPIRVNRQEVKSDIQKDTAVTSLANRSFTKGTKPHANNSLRLGSIFDTFSTHASEMATYSAWLGTLEDINRIRNYTFRDKAGHAEDTVKSIIETVHGTSGNTYLDKLIADVTNGVKGTHGETSYMSGIVGNFKAAAVGANLRVIIQQPTAMLRAADMIGAQHMATVGNPLNGWKKALKYAPIAQWKDWGYFDINTGRQMKDVLFDSDTLLDKTKSLSMWGAGAMDSVAWGHLWNAVESETKAKHEELKPGTDAFYKAVAERFTEIVDHTQVVDGILQRSQIMRSADGITKMATSFMGEPTKQYNMMMQAAYDAKSTRGKDRKVAMKKLARTSVVLAISGIANAMMQSIIDAVRDDDKEEEYWEKLLAAFKKNLGSTFNPVSYVPFAKDILSILQGYDVSRMDMESIEKLVSAGQNMIKALSGEGKHTVPGAAINLIAEIARLYGIPVSNLKREITSFAMLAAVENDNFVMQYRMEKWMLNMNNSTNRSTFTNILYKSYKNDKEAFEIIYADMLEEDKFRRVNDEGEVTTTADYIAFALNGRVIDDLFALYNSDQTAYKEMYNDLVKRDFLRKGDKSTADIINDAMETRMKKDQGVDGVTDLEQRYYSPADQIRYDNIMGSVQKSGLWSAATEKQRDHLRGDIHEYLTGDSKAAQEMVEDMNDAKNYGIDETEYLLWNLALEMYDTPSDSGEYGSYNTREKADALAAMTTLSDKEKAYLWSTKTTSDEVWDAFDAGVDIGDYVDFKAALSELEAGVDYKKGDTKSRKRAVNNLLDALGITGADRNWLYHTEYKK